MRIISLASFLLLFVSIFAAPAFAGSVTYADMRGKWEPTNCKAPVAPAALARDSEAAANDLNAYVTARNEYTGQVQAYMDCLSKEAGRDAEAVSLLITKSAQAMIDKMMAETAPLATGQGGK